MRDEIEQIDSTIKIVTPENIAFRYQLAGPFRRLPAFLLDLMIRIFVFAVFAFGATVLFGVTLGGMGATIGMSLALLVYFVLEWFYGGLLETYMNGQTPGKRVMGIRVLSTNGQPVNGMQAVMRNVLRSVDMMPLLSLQMIDAPAAYMIPTFLGGLLCMAFTRRFQRLGDIVCGTIVVIEERRWLTGVARLEDPRVAQLAALIPGDFEVSQSLARTLATYVERRRFLSTARRREIARHLGEPLLERFNMPHDTSHDLLLCALYHRTFITEHAEDDAPDYGQRSSSPFKAGHAPVNDAPAIQV